MSNLLFQTIDQISREKGIDPQIVIHAIEDAIVVASRKYFKSNEELRGRINPDTGEIDVLAVRKVVEEVTNPVREISLDEARETKPDAQMDEEIEFLKPTVGLGRIAAQMAKQVIFQKVREAERESVFTEYHKHVGEIVNCVVKRYETGDIIVELGKTEGKLAQAGSVPAGKLFRRRSHSRRDHQSRQDRKRSAGHGVANGPCTGAAPVPDRSSGNLRRHGTDPKHCAGSRRANQNRRDLTRKGRRSRRRLRRHEGYARAVHHPRTARGKDRHHPMER